MSLAIRMGASESLHERVLNEIGRRIVTGDLKPGDVLGSQLETEYGVGRSVLREVFRALQGKGLITARPKIGTRVTDRSAWNYLDEQVVGWRLRSEDRHAQIEELYELRLAVEPRAASILAARKGANVGRLRVAVSLMSAAWSRRDTNAFATADVEYHTALLELTGNNMFAGLSDVMSSALRIRETFVFPLEEAILSGLELHRSLIEDISQGKKTAAATAERMVIEAHSELEYMLRAQGLSS
jgi:DNA-binding FadR family transcriptional regulator